jgi:hypothetical protein
MAKSVADTPKPKNAVHYFAQAKVKSGDEEWLEDTIVIAFTRAQAVNAIASRVISVTKATSADLLRAGRDKIPVLDATAESTGPVQVDLEDV